MVDGLYLPRAWKFPHFPSTLGPGKSQSTQGLILKLNLEVDQWWNFLGKHLGTFVHTIYIYIVHHSFGWKSFRNVIVKSLFSANKNIGGEVLCRFSVSLWRSLVYSHHGFTGEANEKTESFHRKLLGAFICHDHLMNPTKILFLLNIHLYLSIPFILPYLKQNLAWRQVTVGAWPCHHRKPCAGLDARAPMLLAAVDARERGVGLQRCHANRLWHFGSPPTKESLGESYMSLICQLYVIPTV